MFLKGHFPGGDLWESPFEVWHEMRTCVSLQGQFCNASCDLSAPVMGPDPKVNFQQWTAMPVSLSWGRQEKPWVLGDGPEVGLPRD